MGQPLEVDHHFAAFGGHPLAGAQVKGNIGPTPVVDIHPDGYKGLCTGVGIAAFFFQVSWHGLAFDKP